MKSFLTSSIFVFALQNIFAAQSIKDFLSELPKEDVSILEHQFRKMMRSDEGYVIYGDKPMSISGVHNSWSIQLENDPSGFSEMRTYEILKEWDLASTDRKFIILFCNTNHEYLHLITINRQAFLKAVNENISLFRYILEIPNLTAEKLLADLVNNKEHFYEIIKNNDALTGILLGYGTNNSISHCRELTLINEKKYAEINFPYVIGIQKNQATGEIRSINEEYKLIPKSSASTELRSYESYSIPYFGCDPNSEETLSLLSTYEKNRTTILSAVNQKDFFEKTVEKILTSTSNELKIPILSKKKASFNPNDQQAMAHNFAEIIFSETKIKDLNQDFLIEQFLRGIDEYEKKIKSDLKPTYTYEVGLLKHNLLEVRNLEKSDAILRKLTMNKSWIPLIENNVLYKILKNGTGRTASSKINDITFHYSFRSMSSQKEIAAGTINHAKLDNLIPGIAHSLIAMKKGEERIVYIHPRYAYGDSCPFINEAIIATIQLVDFKEGKDEVAICPERSLDSQIFRIIQMNDSMFVSWHPKESRPKQLDPHEWFRERPKGTSKDILALYEQAKGEYFYFKGRDFWESLKEHKISIDCEELKKHLYACKKKSELRTEEERMAFLTDFKKYLFYMDNPGHLP